MTSDRNRTITELRHSGKTFAAIGRAFGISTERVRQIVEKVEQQETRARELEEAARLPEQPNRLHLPVRLRTMLAEASGKLEFTPADIEAMEFTESTFFRIPNFDRRDWRELKKWMARAGKPPVPFKRTIADWLRSNTDERRNDEKQTS